MGCKKQRLLLKHTNLQPKLVEGVVEQVLEAGHQALVQSVPGSGREQGLHRRGGALHLAVVVDLVTVHCGLKHQQHQDHQMILEE